MKTTLLIVSGMSPAIVTETVWALHQKKTKVDFIRIITTKTGANRIKDLFSQKDYLSKKSPWQALTDYLGSEAPLLKETGNHIRIIAGENGEELEDIITEADNQALANFILDEVRAITTNPDNKLIASVAGGRKTMGTILYAATSLLGRETDTITHVLVNPPYETSPWFWFPDQPGNYETDPKKAEVQLGKIPFVPLQETVKSILGNDLGSFQNVVASCSKLFSPNTPKIKLLLNEKKIEIENQKVKVPPRPFSLLRFLAEESTPKSRYCADTLKEWNAKAKTWGEPTLVETTEVSHALHELRKIFKTFGPVGIKLAELLPKGNKASGLYKKHFQIKP